MNFDMVKSNKEELIVLCTFSLFYVGHSLNINATGQKY